MSSMPSSRALKHPHLCRMPTNSPQLLPQAAFVAKAAQLNCLKFQRRDPVFFWASGPAQVINDTESAASAEGALQTIHVSGGPVGCKVSQPCTWTPKVYTNHRLFLLCLDVFGHSFTYFLGPGNNSKPRGHSSLGPNTFLFGELKAELATRPPKKRCSL